jgi:hypothetical protein
MPETEQERSGQIVSYQNRTRLLASNRSNAMLDRMIHTLWTFRQPGWHQRSGGHPAWSCSNIAVSNQSNLTERRV